MVGLADIHVLDPASLLNQTFRRIQFTPNLMPADITGMDILEEEPTTGKTGIPVRERAVVRQHDSGLVSIIVIST